MGRRGIAAGARSPVARPNACTGDGMAAIDRGDYEQGVADLQQALAQDPGNIAYKLDYEARRDSAVQKLIGLADSARGIGQFDLAVADYQRVLAIDPSNVRAQKGLEHIEGDKRHGAALALARAGLRAQGLRGRGREAAHHPQRGSNLRARAGTAGRPSTSRADPPPWRRASRRATTAR